MKLSLKIFLGILFPSALAVIFISFILIEQNFNTNLDLQLSLYQQELDSIDEKINEAIDNDYGKVIRIVGKYYADNGKYLALYNGKEPVYSNNKKILPSNTKLLDLEDNSYNNLIEIKDGHHYVYIAIKEDDRYNLVYMRNIEHLYEQRSKQVTICIVAVSILFIMIIFIAFLIAKTLTKPLLSMKRQMNKLSNGDFDIHLKEGKDEIGQVAKEFNHMGSELNKRDKELMNMIDSKQLFIDNLSHEMNTPLTSIYGYSKLLESAQLDEEQKIKYLQYIQSETGRILEMYKKLLTLSYKENNQLEKTDNSVEEILHELQNELCSKLNDKKINLVIENNINTINCDKMLISLATSNLIRNAIEISEEGKTITVKIYKENNKNYVCVIDEGKGIEQEQIDKIVEPFYRVDKARSRAHGGAGLGLSIVTRIMELHEGKLIIKSQVNVGSNFILEIPE